MSNRSKHGRGTPRAKKGSNPRRGSGGYQKNWSVSDALHMGPTPLHEYHHDLNEGRDNAPEFFIQSPALNAKLAEYKELVEELRLYLPDLPQISNYVAEKDVLRPADKAELVEHLRDLLRTRIFFWGKNVKGTRTYYERRFLRTGPKSKRLPSCAQGLRVSHSPVMNFFNRERLALAEAEGPEAARKLQQEIQAEEEAFFPTAQRIIVAYTGMAVGGEISPLTAAELIAADKHRDTGLAHDDYVVSEIREMDAETAVELGIPIYKPLGKKKVEKYGKQQCDEIIGRAFLRVGKPQMGRQGPAMVGWHLQKLAGYELPKEQADQYARKITRGRTERGYGDDGLGIDVALNAAFYSHCKQNAASKGLTAQWAKAEADYVDWLKRAASVKQEISRLRELAALSFDADQDKKAAMLRRRDVETMRSQVRAALHPAPFDDAQMRELAKAHPLRNIAELVLDGVATIPDLMKEAAVGLAHFITWLAKLFASGVVARMPLAHAEVDHDFEASVEKAAARRPPVMVVKEVTVERIVEVEKVAPQFDLRAACDALIAEYGKELAQAFYNQASIVRASGDPPWDAEEFLAMVAMMRRQGISQDYVAKMITNKVAADRQAIATARGTTLEQVARPEGERPIDPVIAQAAAAWTAFFEDDFARSFPAVSAADRRFFAAIAAGTPVRVKPAGPYRPFTKGDFTGPVHELRKIMGINPAAARINYELWKAGKLELPRNPKTEGPKIGK
jgi:hypothetical protein